MYTVEDLKRQSLPTPQLKESRMQQEYHPRDGQPQ